MILKQPWQEKLPHKLTDVIFNSMNSKWKGGRFFVIYKKHSILYIYIYDILMSTIELYGIIGKEKHKTNILTINIKEYD